MNTKSNFGRLGWLVILYVLFLYMFSSTPPDTLNVTAGFFANALGLPNSNPLLIFSAVEIGRASWRERVSINV